MSLSNKNQGAPGKTVLTPQSPQPILAWQFESSNVESIEGLPPTLSTTGAYAAPTGGTITTVSNKRIHTFTTVGTSSITFLVPTTIQLLVVAGGGGGGANNASASAGGGGGSGEVYYSASTSVSAGTYTVTVGASGIAGISAGARDGGDGGDSVFNTIIAAGGGGGGGPGGALGGDGLPGGSGGGAGRGGSLGGASVTTAGGLGNAGGNNASAANYSGAGGGGSATAGTDASVSGSTPVPGGTGNAFSISGTSVTYAAGGTGGARAGVYTPVVGTNGLGEGGAGAPAGTGTAVNGAIGGSGVVIISYNAAVYPAPTYVTGKYGRAINFNNTLSLAGADPNCYMIYDISEFSLSTSSSTMSLWLNSGLTYPGTTGTTPFYINLQGSGYNGLYTSGTSSNITFRTSAPGAVNAGTFPGQTGVWGHHCAVFSNVGAGVSNTITYYYVNGSLVGSANNAIQTFTELRLGCQNSGSNGALCSIDDIRLFDTALSAAQVRAIAATQGMPSRQIISGATVFSQLSTAATSAAVGVYSLRAVNAVTARAIRILRKSDNAQQDFWADRLGNLLTAPITGRPLEAWLAGSAANVLTWYDQSSSGRNATGTAATLVKTSNVNQNWAINPTSGGLSVSGGAFLNGTDFTITCTTRRLGTQGNDGVYGYGANTSWVGQASVPTTYGNNTRFGLAMPNAGSTAVVFNDSSFSPAFSSNANVLPSAFVAATEPVVYTGVTLTAATQRMYINGTANGIPISTLTQVTANASAGFTIGSIGAYGNFLGEIGELLIFNTVLGVDDISKIYLVR